MKSRFLVIFLLYFFSLESAFAKPARHKPSYAAMVIDAATGASLHADYPDRQVRPASLTKMMTLYLLFDALESRKLKLTSLLPVSKRATQMEPSRLGLKVGEKITVENAILGLCVKSANDVAVVVAEALGGSEQAFAERMTRKARELGMGRTTFKNASGLPHAQQFTTARDMATLSRHLLRRHAKYTRYFSVRHFKYKNTLHRNTNHLLGKYPGLDGIKTGYTGASGFNLSASARRGSVRLITVVMGGATSEWRNARVTLLMDRAFHKLGLVKAPMLVHEPETFVIEHERKGKNKITKQEWAIQIGAYSQYQRAHKTAQEIQKKYPHICKKKRPFVPKIVRQKSTLYKACLDGFTKAEAEKTCTHLTAQGLECLPIPSSSPSPAKQQVKKQPKQKLSKKTQKAQPKKVQKPRPKKGQKKKAA